MIYGSEAWHYMAWRGVFYFSPPFFFPIGRIVNSRLYPRIGIAMSIGRDMVRLASFFLARDMSCDLY